MRYRLDICRDNELRFYVISSSWLEGNQVLLFQALKYFLPASTKASSSASPSASSSTTTNGHQNEDGKSETQTTNIVNNTT